MASDQPSLPTDRGKAQAQGRGRKSHDSAQDPQVDWSRQLPRDCVGLMMTFLSLKETSLMARTCHAWLRVAYDYTPRKEATLQLRAEESSAVVKRKLRSVWRRHFTKIELCINKMILPEGAALLALLCSEMKADLKELTVKKFIKRNKHMNLDRVLTWSLTPLQPLLQLTRLTLQGLKLQKDHLYIIKEMSQLTTFQYLSPSGEPMRWTLEDLQAFCLPGNRLTNLREFPINFTASLSGEHLVCLKRLPLEAITSLIPTYGIMDSCVHEIHHFQFVRRLAIEIIGFPSTTSEIALELMAQLLQQLPKIDTLKVSLRQPYQFKSGDVEKLLLHSHQLTSITFYGLQFPLPECLNELPSSLVDLRFHECPGLKFRHFKHLCHLTSLERLRCDAYTREHFNQRHLDQLLPPNSIIPALKELKFL